MNPNYNLSKLLNNLINNYISNITFYYFINLCIKNKICLFELENNKCKIINVSKIIKQIESLNTHDKTILKYFLYDIYNSNYIIHNMFFGKQKQLDFVADFSNKVKH